MALTEGDVGCPAECVARRRSGAKQPPVREMASQEALSLSFILFNSPRAIISSMTSKKFSLPRKEIEEFCKRWSITEFSVFGSVLREDFRSDSDIDVLISIDPKAQIGLFEIAQMQIELEDLFQRPVDIVEKEGLINPYRRSEILSTAQVVYAAG
jgi:predicted nucleotidyltransferase